MLPASALDIWPWPWLSVLPSIDTIILHVFLHLVLAIPVIVLFCCPNGISSLGNKLRKMFGKIPNGISNSLGNKLRKMFGKISKFNLRRYRYC